jgi:HlyD family secretion protein
MKAEHGNPSPEASAAAPSPGTPPNHAFPRHAPPSRPNLIVKPTPLPKRPKGRWFVAVLLLAVCSFAGYQVWQAFFRYQAYGTVTAHVIQVSPPWDGAVTFLYAREGQRVRQGELLATVENTELRQRHAQLGDELRVAQANLEAETGKLKWQAAFNLDQGPGAIAQYYQTLGQLMQEQSRLEDLKTSLRRAETLHARNTLSDEEYDLIRFSREGQEKKVEQLRTAVAELKKRADQAELLLKKTPGSGGLEASGMDQLKPFLAKIEVLQYERIRLQERIDQGEIRAPANGLVVKRLRLVGERCKAGEPLLTFLEDGSLRVVLYLPQSASEQLAVDGDVDVVMDPYPDKLRCTVTRVGDEYEAAPEQIKRNYNEGQKLLPVTLKPDDEWERWMALRPGGVVKLPYRLSYFVPRKQTHED